MRQIYQHTKLINALALTLVIGMLLANTFSYYLIYSETGEAMELADFMDFDTEEEEKKSEEEKNKVWSAYLSSIFSSSIKAISEQELIIIAKLHHQETPTPPPKRS